MKKLVIVLSVLLVLILIGFHFADLNPTITSTSSFEMKGIDISHYNSISNWDSVSNQVGFCIIKATEGSNFKDPMFNSNWKSTKKNNLVRGAYHYFSPGVSGKKQFNNFKNAVKFINSFEQTAAELAIDKGYQFVICGHIHQPEIRTITTDKGSVTYLNSGDWVENLSALEYHNGEWVIYKYDPKKFDDKHLEEDLEQENLALDL